MSASLQLHPEEQNSADEASTSASCTETGPSVSMTADNTSGSAARRVGVAPSSLERQPPGMGGDQLMDRFRPPRAGGIKSNRRRSLEQGHRDLPKPFDTLGGRKLGTVAAHRVEGQGLIGFEHIADHARFMHGELQAQLVQPH